MEEREKEKTTFTIIDESKQARKKERKTEYRIITPAKSQAARARGTRRATIRRLDHFSSAVK